MALGVFDIQVLIGSVYESCSKVNCIDYSPQSHGKILLEWSCDLE